ncbi:PREDICTED: leucine-rich repeat and coiled-coil domain-containing protein 1-like [Acropora digitifera]|uniref:leucine-rich repeat and coiled-coil domain-containing protein 1-like n=1 Tax=Acropora digitifera TaxID=70779 RepID=UPI00077AC4F4|nr:PREDICTED: leucine-rich repeat and coiled-coil domain-containing protein 1-like [Acropora digitifera]
MASGKNSFDVVSHTFPKEICFIDAQINSLFDVHLDSGLISLNLHCNNISVIENLDKLKHLKHLDLSSNHIAKMRGLGGLMSLKTLNLACNELQVVEGLENLRNLAKLDLSYNNINSISGLRKLHGPSFSLCTLYLQGNQLSSLDHVINSLNGCLSLKELTLSQYGEANPVCELPDYRSRLFTSLKSIQILDGLDHSGNPAASRDSLFIIPELEDYVEYLGSETSVDSNMRPSKFEVVTPRIDSVLGRFRQQGKLSSETDVAEDEEPSHLQHIPGRVSLSADHEVRLETLEHQLTRLIHDAEKKHAPQNAGKKATSLEKGDSDDSESNEHIKKRAKRGQQSPKSKRATRTAATKKDTGKNRAKPSLHVTVDSTSSTSPTDDQVRKLTVLGKALKGRTVRDPEDDEKILSLIQELDAERERRWKAEQAARKMVDAIKELQLKAECANTAAQEQNIELREKVKNLTESEEDQQRALRALEQASVKMETEKIKQHTEAVSRLQQEQIKVGALAKESELLKHSVKQLKGQVHQLQELLANREQEHRKAVEGLVRVDSQEMRAVVDREVAKQENVHQQIIKEYQGRLNKRDIEYAALEDEFRMGLQIEANRFRELQEAFERVSEQSAQQKEALHSIKQKESKATSMVNELTAMVKEQRGRISELSRGRQDIVGDYKERVQSLEKQLSEANKQLSRLEALEQDKAKLTAQIRAQVSVIEGLRSERKLWSEELAQQGASLAQDRGRLESRVEALTAEVSQLQKECQNANETASIKSKIIEDQTDSIKKLRQKLADQDSNLVQCKEESTARERNLEKQLSAETSANQELQKLADQDSNLVQCKEESTARERNLEKQLSAETSANQELQDQIDALIDRKESLKEELSKTQQDLETCKENHRTLKVKWQEKSELIGKLEKEVGNMRNNFKEKEKTLIEERDKAVNAADSAVKRLKECDDTFRQQLEQEKKSHEERIQTLNNEKQQQIELANSRVRN